MKIVIATHLGRVNGGLEAYLCHLLPALGAAGHDVALWYDTEGGADRRFIEAPANAPRWDAEKLGLAQAIQGLRRWKPDLIFNHGLDDPDTERTILAIAPGVLFAHAYYGACISGAKSRLSPTRAPCSRPLGPPCLVHYLPRQCGGMNPVSMVRLYLLATRQRDLLKEYQAIVIASSYMRSEYLRHGVPEARLKVVDLMLPTRSIDGVAPASGAPASQGHSPVDPNALSKEWRLLFIGRLTELKGVGLLLDALRHLRLSYRGRIALTVIGDGIEMDALQRQARETSERLDNIAIQFTGWLDSAGQVEYLKRSDLLVVPSVWPEPFGLVGPEAGMYGVPATAFDVGGIPAWLHDGVNGHLARGRRPTARRLAEAIERCLRDPEHHLRLRAGAVAEARRFTLDRHMTQILPILEMAGAAGLVGSQ